MRTLVSSILLCLCCACGDAPVAVDSPAADFVAGRAILTGSLAETEEGFLMATLYPAGQRMPILSYKVGIGDASVVTEDGRRVFSFRLDSQSSMVDGTIPEGIPLEVGVRYDRDGFVDSKEGDVSVRIAAEPGDDDLELTLSGDS